MDTGKTCAVLLILSFSIRSIKNDNSFIDKPDTGTKCEWEGKNGTCVNQWTCLTTAIDELYGIKPPICENEGKDGEVYTCCTSCYVTRNITAHVIINSAGMWLTRTGNKSRDKCIDYMKAYNYSYPCFKKKYPGNVVKTYHDELKCFGVQINRWAAAGGVDAKRDEFPHMALLGYGEEQESASWLCGGTVISEWFILTAGHCRSSTQLGEVRFVALGILRRSDPPSLWRVYRVHAFIPHPEYRPPSKYHDIALIRTDKQISLGSAVLPACLAQGSEATDAGQATGWGALGHRQGTADVLQKVEVTGFTPEKCAAMYRPHRHLKGGYNHSTQMCYGDASVGRDTCEGDSGGPLQLEECPHVVFGVTSSGHPCGFAGGAGLYTRVTFYVPWIETIVWP